MSISGELRNKSASLWEAVVTHPFVRELGDGTLSREKFQRYFEQDYLFVKELASLLALGVAKAPDFHSARKLSGFLQLVLGGEEELFRRAFREMGTTEAEVKALRPLPTCLSFTSFLLKTAYEGTFADILATLYCVEGTYLDWAQRLARAGKRPGVQAYQEWIDIHAGPELEGIVGWVKEALDGLGTADETRLDHVFSHCLRFEYMFWEMAYRGEEWPG